MHKWMVSVVAGGFTTLIVLASPTEATPLGSAARGIGAADPSAVELVHHKPGHKMKHRHHGRHYGWQRGKHKGWHKHHHKHHHRH